ncbi:MAG: SDR family oxidoreductase [Burkholderiales bacterium]|nr:SDR family oxidoreductase [Burkholderiales bacterium]OJX04630.1 MAG: oxidoreductase [Burkholderiales bacterium 70-64]
MNGRLHDKVAIVTGSGSGIGRGCAIMFAREGARVVGCDIDVRTAAETVELAQAEGLRIDSFHPCDLTRAADVRRLVEFAVERHGGLDVLVNAGAFGAFAWIEEMDHERDWKRTLAGELDVVFLACQAAWPHLKARGGGAIINFASASARVAFRPLPSLAHCAGKGGVLAMTRQLAMEGGPHGIRANTISPALVETTATRIPLETIPDFREEVLDKCMIRRLGRPEDIGWCAIYLASDEAGWVTGADFPIDGGTTAW